MTIHHTPWPPGMPCWVDMMVTDEEAARAFYSGLFAWEYNIQPPEYGGYAVATKGGNSVAGIGGKMAADQPSAWITYLSSADATATATKITEAGGVIHVAPMQVGSMGTMCIAVDSTEAVFGVWQTDQMIGAEVVNEAGGFVWNQHFSRDWESAKTFYRNALGLIARSIPDDPDAAINTLHLSDDPDSLPVGGVSPMEETAPAGMPAHWLTYFGVLDTDATVTKAVELGGTIIEEASDTPWGRQAVLAGAEGELFAVMSVPPEGQAGSQSG